MKRIYGTLIGMILGSTVAGTATLIYMAFFDFRVPPVTMVYSHPNAVEYGAKKREEIKDLRFIKAGDPFYTYREFCITSPFRSIEAVRMLVRKSQPSEFYPLPKLPSRFDGNIGCQHKTFASTVPVEVPPGEYVYKSETVYMVIGNPIGTFVWQWPDVAVIVVPK